MKVIYHLNVSENISTNNHWTLSEWSVRLFFIDISLTFSSFFFNPNPNFQWIFIDNSTNNYLSFNAFLSSILYWLKFKLLFNEISTNIHWNWNSLKLFRVGHTVLDYRLLFRIFVKQCTNMQYSLVTWDRFGAPAVMQTKNDSKLLLCTVLKPK